MDKKRILVIDDDQDICKLLAFRFRKAEFDVAIAHDSENGLQEAKQSLPDLIILDLVLPTLSGEEVCKAIRGDDYYEDIKNTPIIMLTAKNTEVDRIIGKVIGANCYMGKPFDMDALLREIHRLI